MFTGIVTHRGVVRSLEPAGPDGALRLVIEPDQPLEHLSIGDSIAVDGCCLTATCLDDGRLAFDAIPETLRKTTLGARRVGDEVNLERALRVGEALGGHWVQGHVDGVGTIEAVEARGEDVRIVLSVAEGLHGGMLVKGSVTLDGVSLTVGEVWREAEGERPLRFSVYLIPHTLAVTGFGRVQVGDAVNIEADVMGRWVLHHLERLRADLPGA
jgi:riboflavin synthase